MVYFDSVANGFALLIDLLCKHTHKHMHTTVGFFDNMPRNCHVAMPSVRQLTCLQSKWMDKFYMAKQNKALLWLEWTNTGDCLWYSNDDSTLINLSIRKQDT